ncbi:MAG: hypothetical protein JWM58_2896, partial [Rhizobium sp.]|nr:hypothetical protein [Rhizobium sp.]
MLASMDSPLASKPAPPLQPSVVPGWALARGSVTGESDAAFIAG